MPEEEAHHPTRLFFVVSHLKSRRNRSHTAPGFFRQHSHKKKERKEKNKRKKQQQHQQKTKKKCFAHFYNKLHLDLLKQFQKKVLDTGYWILKAQ